VPSTCWARCFQSAGVGGVGGVGDPEADGLTEGAGVAGDGSESWAAHAAVTPATPAIPPASTERRASGLSTPPA
jgi:hypothetical protein